MVHPQTVRKPAQVIIYFDQKRNGMHMFHVTNTSKIQTGSEIGPLVSFHKPFKAMQQYLKRKTIKSSVRDCIAAMPDNPACYQLVFGDDYFWS